MAITILQSLGNNLPAYNSVAWVVSSTNTAQENFEYICDVYITGETFAGGASYLRLKTPADPLYGRGVFNVFPILNRYVTGDIDNTIYGFQQCSNSVKEYVLKFGELYGPSSGIIAYPDLALSTSLGVNNIFNGSLGVLERKDYTNALYNANVYTSPVSFLTNAPSSGTINITEEEDAWIYVLSQTSGAIKYANINTYTGTFPNKILFFTYRVINHQYHNTSTVANRMLRFPAGYNMNSIPNSDIVYTNAAVLPIFFYVATTLWEIYFTDTNKNRITESYWFAKSSECTAHTRYRLHFKNKFGGYDSFSFIRASQKSAEITRKKFEKVMGEFKSASSYVYNKTDRFETNYHTEYKHTLKLQSDWINEDQSVWLEELITSPDIRLDDATHGLVPINIVETNYVQRQHKTDKIFNLEINIQYTFSETRQGA